MFIKCSFHHYADFIIAFFQVTIHAFFCCCDFETFDLIGCGQQFMCHFFIHKSSVVLVPAYVSLYMFVLQDTIVDTAQSV